MRSRAPSSADATAHAAALATRLEAASTTLGRLWRERVLPVAATADAATLDAWADAVLALRADGGWRAERVAQALLAAAERALALFAADEVGRWLALTRHLHPALDEALALAALPTAVAAWSAAERRTWIEAALALPPAAALALYRDVPATLAGLDAPMRMALLAVLGRFAGAPPAEVAPALALAAALLRAVPPASHALAVSLLGQVADRFPPGAPALLGSLPRLFEEAPAERVVAWVDCGLEIAAEQPEAGRAFFALASRTSLRVLRNTTTAVGLDEVQGVLRRLVHMLSGVPAVPRAAGRFQLRPPLEESPDHGAVALPATVDMLDTWEDNARLYRVCAALLAGRREHATYAAIPDLATHLRAPERPAVLEDCFLLADGVRVAHALGRDYPGLAADLRWASARLLRASARRPAPLFDLLLARALAGADAPAGPPWLEGTAALVLPSLAPLAAPDATAADALRLAERLATLFPESERGLGGEVIPELAMLLVEAGDEGPPAGPGTPQAGGTGGEDDGEDAEPLPPELLERLELMLDEQLGEGPDGAAGLSPDELRRLLEAGIAATLGQSRGAVARQAGLFVTQLLGKRLAEGLVLRAPEGTAPAPPARRIGHQRPGGAVFRYDEWDHVIGDYRPEWCALREVALPGDSGLYFDRALARHAALVPEVRRQFQLVRPELYRPLRGLEDGEEFDLGALVDARAERRARQAPSPKLYTARVRQEREVATLFLLDMSASTDETAPNAGERIIDIAKDALVIMAAALEEIGDQYAVYGFSGQGREQVEVYPIKHFGERLGPAVRGRIGGIEPRGSTRMGAALRHVLVAMRGLSAPARHLILLSDGFPQDLDYGSDRQSHLYGIRDTAVALREVQAAGVRPFCITVDLAGHDYLREMCDPQQYLVIERVAALPRELPKIYQRLVRAA